MRRKNTFWDTLLVTSIVALAGICAQWQAVALAEENNGLEGPIVQIGPAADNSLPKVDTPEADQTQEPVYWIGIRGQGVNDPVLRTQLQLAEDMGVVVEDVVPDSPAAKADLRRHDIILRADGDAVNTMAILQEHVMKGKGQPMELLLLRLGKETTIQVTPEPRPEKFNQLAEEAPQPGAGVGLDQLMQQFQGQGMPGGIRVFGPGMVLRGNRIDINKMPNGMTVAITRENDGPAKITVKQGDKEWTFNSDDAEALTKLPAEVRAFVDNMLKGQEFDWQKELGNLDWQAELRHMLPERLGNLPGLEELKAKEDKVQERMNELEKKLEELQKKLEAEEAAAK